MLLQDCKPKQNKQRKIKRTIIASSIPCLNGLHKWRHDNTQKLSVWNTWTQLILPENGIDFLTSPFFLLAWTEMHVWTRLIIEKKISCEKEFCSCGFSAVKWEDVTARTRGENVFTMMIMMITMFFSPHCLPNKSISWRILDNHGCRPMSDEVQFIDLEPVDHINGTKSSFGKAPVQDKKKIKV